ncbi:MAG TPA: hypothetical protein VNO32_24980, partial [Candidatus Acidoferrum sp.]|nr:hypothetical protein [Candidatus Acidoferrum sp.]
MHRQQVRTQSQWKVDTHDCIGVVSGDRLRADERVSFGVLEHQQVVFQLCECRSANGYRAE